MSMYTRCSSCSTHFRVTVQQLQACSGQVRCGRCGTVFDAFASLTARAPGKSEDPPPLQGSERPRWDTPPPVPPMPPVPTHVTYASAGATEVLSIPPSKPLESKIQTLSLPEDLFDLRPKGEMLRGPAWAWVAGFGALVLLALIQALYLFRTDIAAAAPSVRPTLMALCKPFSCAVPLPRLPEQLFIETSDLQVMDPSRPHEVLLTASIRNRADKLQAHPTLELTLTNTLDHPIAKKLFAPKDYLSSPQAEEQGFPPGAEVAVRLLLNTHDLRAAGYRLYLFFPS